MGNCAGGTNSTDEIQSNMQRNQGIKITNKEQGQLHSGIMLHTNIYVRFTSTDSNFEEETKQQTHTKIQLHYKLTYCGKDHIWKETCLTNIHKSKDLTLEYMLGY
jgi:hypothetical protein